MKHGYEAVVIWRFKISVSIRVQSVAERFLKSEAGADEDLAVGQLLCRLFGWVIITVVINSECKAGADEEVGAVVDGFLEPEGEAEAEFKVGVGGGFLFDDGLGFEHGRGTI